MADIEKIVGTECIDANLAKRLDALANSLDGESYCSACNRAEGESHTESCSARDNEGEYVSKQVTA